MAARSAATEEIRTLDFDCRDKVSGHHLTKTDITGNYHWPRMTKRFDRGARLGHCPRGIPCTSASSSKSGAARAYGSLGIPYAESQGRFQEALEIILEAWKGEAFSYQGKFYRFENATVSPRPCQLPHPPIRMAANSVETFPFVGRLGLPLFVGLRDLDIPELKAHLQAYRAAWRDAGHGGQGDVCLRIPIYAGATEKEAVEEPYENITYFFRRHAELTRSGLGRADTGPGDRRRARVEKLDQMSYDEILQTRVAFGTAAGLIDRLGRLQTELGLTGLVAELNPGGLLSMEHMRRTLRILTHEVIPALR